MSDLGNRSGAQLRAFIERIERLEEEKAAVADQVREVFAEAKGDGYDARAMRALIRERRLTPDELAERAAILDLYRDALGALADTPLGAGAQAQAGKAATEAVRALRDARDFKQDLVKKLDQAFVDDIAAGRVTITSDASIASRRA